MIINSNSYTTTEVWINNSTINYTTTVMSNFNYRTYNDREWVPRGTKKQHRARNRNRCKYTLCGIKTQISTIKSIQEGSLSENEVILIKEIEDKLIELINNWDLESVKIGFKPKRKLSEKWSLES